MGVNKDNPGQDMPSKEERKDLLKLIEECSEVQHVCCKILRYGWDFVPGAHYPDKILALIQEINDLRSALAGVDAVIQERQDHQT